MSDKVKGVVQKITKNKAYSVLLDDNVFYGAGFDEPNFKEGYTIEFEISYNGKYKNINQETLKIVSSTPAKTATTGKSKSGGTSNRDDYWTSKAEQDVKTQREIRLQASRNAAIAFTELLLANSLVSLGTKKAAQVGIVEDTVNHYTRKFYLETVDINSGEDAEPVAAETTTKGDYE